MFSCTWKFPFLNDDLIDIAIGAILSADVTDDLLTAYQKDKADYIQCIGKRLSQIKSNNFLYHYDVFIFKNFFSINRKNIRFDSKVITLSKFGPTLFGKMCHIAQKERFKYDRGDEV